MAASLPDGRRGRALATALGLVVAAAIWAAMVEPLISWHAYQAQRLEQREALERRMEALAATLPSLQARAAARTEKGPVSSAMLQGETDAVAGAALQQMVQEMASAAGTSLSSIEVLPAETIGGYRRIGLHVALAAPWPVLVHLLQSIEAATPPMLVDDLRLQGPPMGNAALPMDTSFTVLVFRAGGRSREGLLNKRAMTGGP
jgi:general secretion pathway protein M